MILARSLIRRCVSWISIVAAMPALAAFGALSLAVIFAAGPLGSRCLPRLETTAIAGVSKISSNATRYVRRFFDAADLAKVVAHLGGQRARLRDVRLQDLS